jgi:hypothetical protein
VSQIDRNPFVIASGSRDGSLLVFDIRCNIQTNSELSTSSETSCIKAIHTIKNAHFIESAPHSTAASHHTSQNHSRILKAKTPNLQSSFTPSSCFIGSSSALKKSSPVSCVVFQNDFYLASSGKKFHRLNFSFLYFSFFFLYSLLDGCLNFCLILFSFYMHTLLICIFLFVHS